ncbi:MAG: hypothetical protein KDA25_06150, partial [Phycisphaerales bacterium]|nr:hypothetical protein [Phycisphaerales bacterium]
SAIPATPTTTPVTPAAAPPSAPTETPAPVAPPAETTPVAPVLPRELPTMPEPSADAKASAMLDRLDVRLGALRDEPLASAEVQPLRQLYLAIAENPEVETDALRDYAKTRARQLEVWSQTQQKLRDLDALTARLDRAGERSRLGVLALESGIAYTAVGRLVSSTIFDGRGLPQLLRVQDSGSGRTVVYIDASQAPQATGHLGLMVGIVGEKRFDPSLRLHVVRPTRIDTLSPQR